jgi:glycosyltransferase involved in cell wall biosynthesis
MSIDFTVAVPTYNGADRIVQLLDKLRSQINTENFSWEILIVDNNSKDNTAQIVQKYQENWSERYPLKYYFEAEQGAAFARRRAVYEALGEWIGFLDDDILPDENWVAAAYSFGKEHPEAGAYGGQIHAEFDASPPDNFKRIQSFLAIRERGSKPHLYQPERLVLPPSASVVVQRKAWLESLPSQPLLKGRVGKSMMGGEDFEIMLHLHQANWEIWYNPAMQAYHKIPQWRLERKYLLSLVRGAGICICHLRTINVKNWRKPGIIATIVLGALRRAFLHLLKYRLQVKTDLVAACEMEFFLSTMLSPFYLLRSSMFFWRKS